MTATSEPEGQTAVGSRGSLARQRRAVAGFGLLGALTLALAMSREPGSAAFLVVTTLLALIWVGGAFVVGPPALGRWRRTGHRDASPIVPGIATGLAVSVLFTLGALAVAQVPALESLTEQVLDHATGAVPLVVLLALVTGAGEELFFRGAVYDVLPRHRVWGTALIYLAVTAVTLNLMLVLAAGVLGVVTALQRRATGGVLAPLLTHLVWSSAMLLVLPRLLAGVS